MVYIPFEQRTEALWVVGCAGYAPDTALTSAGLAGTRVVPQRYIYAFVS